MGPGAKKTERLSDRIIPCEPVESESGRKAGTPAADDYELIDSGEGRKLERFGKYRLIRPCAQAIWRPRLGQAEWRDADASFDRLKGNRWNIMKELPDQWIITVSGMKFRLSATDFGHLGIFPEQRDLWSWITDMLVKAKARFSKQVSVLNLFAYSGGATMASARTGARVCHVDASKGMVKWARENAVLNGLEEAPVQWIVEDVNRFLDREIRRGKSYDAIILDPPTFGHGRRKEIYKIDEELQKTLEKCRALMSGIPVFMLLSSHTPYLTPVGLANFLRNVTQGLPDSGIEQGEMLLTGAPGVLPVPSGTYARWFSV